MNSYIEFGIFMSLLDGKVHKASSLAEQFEISKKTVYRNIDRLVSAGFPLTSSSGKNGGIYLAGKFMCNTWFFSEKELGYMLNLLSSSPSFDSTTSKILYYKLKEHISSQNMNDATKLSNKFFVDTTNWFCHQKASSADYQEIIKGCEDEQQMLITYCGNPNTRLIDPACVIYKEGSYYLYAYCHLREDFRLFKLDKIDSIKILDSHCQVICQNLQDKPWNNSTEFKIVDILLQASSQTAKDISAWAKVTPLKENLVQISATNNLGLIHKLMEYGEKIRVIKPQSIKDDLIKECQKIIQNYA